MSRVASHCPVCGLVWPRAAQFCASCGQSRREVETQRRERRGARGALVAIVLMFVGAVAAVWWGGWLATLGWSEFASSLATDGALCGLALLGAALTEAAALLRAFPMRVSIASALRGLAVGVLCLVVSAGYVTLLALLADASEQVSESIESHSALLATWLIVVAAAPLTEELLCRGALWRALERLHPGRTAETLIATAGLFALLHGLNGGFLAEFPHRFAAGLGFGWLRVRCGSVAPCIVAHAVHNGLAMLWGA